MDHVEECPSYYVDCLGTICDCDYSHICMCRELRACEDRVRGEEQQRIEAALKFVGQNDVAWELGIRERTLREAVQRVEALICTDCLEHLRADDGWATCFYCVGVWETLAAIKGGKQ